jgi:hypothetical protein
MCNQGFAAAAPKPLHFATATLPRCTALSPRTLEALRDSPLRGGLVLISQVCSRKWRGGRSHQARSRLGRGGNGVPIWHRR